MARARRDHAQAVEVIDLSVAPGDDVLSFLDTRACRIAFRQVSTENMPRDEQKKRRRQPSPLHLLEYNSGQAPSLIKFPDLNINSPHLSPDSSKIVFTMGGGLSPLMVMDVTSHMITRIGEGVEPSWWVDPENGQLSVIYRDNWGCYPTLPDGGTYCQRINDSCQPVGEPEQLFSHGFSGGLSNDGRYLATGYTHLFVADLQTNQVLTPLGETQLPDGQNQVCNVTIAPDGSSRILCLRIPHQKLSVIDYEIGQDHVFLNPPETLEWQTPRWSVASDYITASGQGQGGNYGIYLIRLSDLETMKLTGFQGYIQAHLWLVSD